MPRTLEFSQILDSHGNVMNVREWSNKCTTVQPMLSHISHSVTYKTPFHTPAGPMYTPHYWGNASNEPTCQRKYWGPSLKWWANVSQLHSLHHGLFLARCTLWTNIYGVTHEWRKTSFVEKSRLLWRLGANVCELASLSCTFCSTLLCIFKRLRANVWEPASCIFCPEFCYNLWLGHFPKVSKWEL